MVMLVLRGSDQKLQRAIAKLDALARPGVMLALHRKFAVEIEHLVARTFSEGRSADGDTWAPLRRRKGRPLVKTGALARSFSTSVTESSVTVRSSAAYAAVHQFGARARGRAGIPARPILPEGALPDGWKRRFTKASRDFFKEHFGA